MQEKNPPKTKLEWALHWQGMGLHIFPCRENGKEPMPFTQGYKSATNDVNQIKAWWAEYPEANIAACPDNSGHWVLDIDVRPEGNGYATLLEYELEYEPLPETFTVDTPSGGKHFWFKGNCDSAIRALGPYCDCKGRAGYLLLPGSRTLAGDYVEASPLEQGISDAPAWLMAKLAERRQRDATPERSAVDTLDLPHNIERGIHLLQNSPTRYQGDGCDARTLEMAMWLKDMGISKEMSLELMVEHYKCEPKDDRFEAFAQRKIEHAWKYGKNEPGSKAIPETIYNEVVINEEEKDNTRVIRFRPRNEREQDARQPPTWLIEGLVPEFGQCLLYGAPGSYKSFIALDIALSVASGVNAIGLPCKQGTVLYVAGEGSLGVEKVRRPAWKLARAVDREVPFWALGDMPFIGSPDDVTTFVKELKEQDINPDLIVIDTLARMAAGLEENSAKDMGVLLMQATKIQRAFNATLLFVHHSGKQEDKGARGSSALLAGFDTVISARANNEAKVVTLYVDKQKDAEPIEPIALRGQSVMGALVFEPIASDEAKGLMQSAGALQRQEVYAALSELGANTVGTGQATKAVAMEILKARGINQDDEKYEKCLHALKNALTRGGQPGKRLNGFVSVLDGSWFWHISE